MKKIKILRIMNSNDEFMNPRSLCDTELGEQHKRYQRRKCDDMRMLFFVFWHRSPTATRGETLQTGV